MNAMIRDLPLQHCQSVNHQAQPALHITYICSTVLTCHNMPSHVFTHTTCLHDKKWKFVKTGSKTTGRSNAVSIMREVEHNNHYFQCNFYAPKDLSSLPADVRKCWTCGCSTSRRNGGSMHTACKTCLELACGCLDQKAVAQGSM